MPVSEPGATGDAAGDAEFLAERNRLWGVAYRVCGSRSDADDVVQEAWLRWHRTPRNEIERPAAWLTTVVGRLSIDRLRSRHRREANYIGPWLPEMIVTATQPDHSDLIDSLTVGFLAMLERLEPIERVVFLLADVFGEPFADIAITVERSEAACRQIASRARNRVRNPQRSRPVDPNEQQRLAAAFSLAVVSGDLVAVRALLRDDAVLLSDGGAAVHAARRPVVGPDRIARFMVNLNRRGMNERGARFEVVTINAEPGVLVFSGDELYLAMVVHVTRDDESGTVQVDKLFVLRNPEKLKSLGRDAKEPHAR